MILLAYLWCFWNSTYFLMNIVSPALIMMKIQQKCAKNIFSNKKPECLFVVSWEVRIRKSREEIKLKKLRLWLSHFLKWFDGFPQDFRNRTKMWRTELKCWEILIYNSNCFLLLKIAASFRKSFRQNSRTVLHVWILCFFASTTPENIKQMLWNRSRKGIFFQTSIQLYRLLCGKCS